MKSFLTVAGVLFLTGTLHAQSLRLYPIKEYVTYDSAQNTLTAVFGYFNNEGTRLNVPFGSNNIFVPAPFFRGQPTSFSPGIYHNVFSVSFPAGSYVDWTLGETTVHASMEDVSSITYQGVSPSAARRQNKSGIIRRRFRMERNFLPQEMQFRWETDEDKFRVEFDLFCDNHCLHGYEGSKPLLTKLAVYPTHSGIVMSVPRYWSLDYRRDLNWKAINALLRAWDIPRQGEKMSLSRAERTEQKRLAAKYDAEARDLGITGAARYDYITAKLGLPVGTDGRVIRKLLE